MVTPDTVGPADIVALPTQYVPPPAGTKAAGAGSTVITTVLIAAAQGPAPSGSLVVNVSITVPLVILGVYVDVREPGAENVPLGALHIEVVALPPIVPARVTVPPAQIDCGNPAIAVAAEDRFTLIAHCGPQQPALVLGLKK